ncbi:RHS repeat domain-containing protein [Oscillatoria salina]|nr:RHS repeat protein [Oscillatoria salina IIICB1]
MVATTDRNQHQTEFTYDDLNRQTSEVWLDVEDNPLRTIDYSYDAASQLIGVSDPDATYSYRYDEKGRLVEVDNTGSSNVPSVVLNYAYDAVDNLLSVTDTIGGLQAGREAFSYDDLNRVTEITQSGNGVSEKRVEMDYDAADQMTRMTHYGDLTGTQLIGESNYTYDEVGRLTTLTHRNNSEVIADYSWTYDAGNRLIELVSPDGTSEYSYDLTDQLVNADYNYQEDESYTYDENGNRVNTGYVTGENNQLRSDGIYNYEYDYEGNRIRRVEIATGEVTEYDWDYRNRLVAVVTKDVEANVTAEAEYTYDVFDHRLSKSVDADGDGAGVAEVERFVYDGDHIALVFDGEGNQTERFLHGTEIDQVLVTENANGEVFWGLGDNQGTIRDVIDSEGTVVNHFTYESFGQVESETNPNVDFRFGYTGRELDEETELYYYRARYYDAGVGRFISEDPIGFDGGDVNLYRYVNNSPLIYTDPSGLLVREATGLLSSGSGLLSGLGSLAGRVAPFLWTPGGGGLLNPLPVNQGEDAFLEQLRNSQPNKPELLPPPVRRSLPPKLKEEPKILLPDIDNLNDCDDDDDIVTIYKAPQPGMGQKLLTQGFHPEDFSDPGGDNLAYFAKQKSLADEYAQYYDEGVLEVDIKKDTYDARIKQHERPYQGGPSIEIPIPHEDFDVLNNAIRRLSE